jgi:alkylated DNA repair protein (DNA oxidative demethylase)
MLYHGIDKLRPGTSSLLPKGGRINLTLRIAT